MNECLTLDQIDRLLSDHLSESEEERANSHLGGCARCRERLEQRTEIPAQLKEAFGSGTNNGIRSDQTELDHLLEIVGNAAPLADDSQDITVIQSQESTESVGRQESNGDQPSPVPDIPGYELLEEIGRGGLGVVYKARQTALGRLVAVKMILPGTFPDSKELARFRREAESVAQLQHPNVVQVIDVIEHEGRPYLCMEFVAGGNLSQQLNSRPQPPANCANVVEVLARAIQAIHERGVLHRDLKPANVMLSPADSATGVQLVTAEGETLNVVPKITDFGLAKQIDKSSGLTDTQAALGTPSYMPPEQVREGKNVHQTADVYSLGAILYEMLTGRPPFRGASAVETMSQVVFQDPLPPSRLLRNLPKDLEAVCLKCLEKEPERRYATAAALADDLRRFQEGLPTIARPATRFDRLWKLCRRNPVVASLLAVLAIVLTVGSVALTIATMRAVESAGIAAAKSTEAARSEQLAKKKANESEQSAIAARAAEKKANDAAYVSAMRLVQMAWESGNRKLVTDQLQALKENNSDGIDRRGFEWFYWDNLAHPSATPLVLKEHTDTVYQLSYSADDRLLASYDKTGRVIVWDGATGKQLQSFYPHGGPFYGALRISPDGKQFATARVNVSDGKVVMVSDGITGESLHTLPVPAIFLDMWYANDTQCLAALRSRKNELAIWSVNEQKPVLHLEGVEKMFKVRAVGNGRMLLVDLGNGNLQLFDAATGRKTQSLTTGQQVGSLRSASLSQDESQIAATGYGATCVWQTRTGELTHLLPRDGRSTRAIKFGPDGKHLIVRLSDGTLQVRPLTDEGVSFTIPGLRNNVECMELSHDGDRLALGMRDGTINIWDTTKLRPIQSIPLPEAENLDVSFSRSGQRYAVAKEIAGVEVVDLVTREFVFQRVIPGDRVFRVLLSPNGLRLAAETGKGIHVWDLSEPQADAQILAREIARFPLAFSPDSKRLAAASEDHVIRVWDAASGEEAMAFKGLQDSCASIAFHPDGRTLIIGSREGVMILWDTASGREVARLTLSSQPLTHMDISPNGRHVALLTANTIHVIEVEQRKRLHQMQGHSQAITGIRFSPDGLRIATASRDNSVKLWDINTGQELLTLREEGVENVFFSSDGGTLLGKHPNKIIVWRIPNQ